MKKLIENFIIIMVLTIAILFSYALIEKKISGRSSSEFINFLFSTQEKASSNKSSVTSNKGNSKKGNNSSTQSADTMNYRAVWLSYLEFNSYRKSVKNNNESSFRKFYKHILQQIKTIGCNRIIVQVRPFGDALYGSDYFPPVILFAVFLKQIPPENGSPFKTQKEIFYLMKAVFIIILLQRV